MPLPGKAEDDLAFTDYLLYILFRLTCVIDPVTVRSGAGQLPDPSGQAFFVVDVRTISDLYQAKSPAAEFDSRALLFLDGVIC